MDELKEYLAEKPEVTSKAPEVTTEKIVEVINMTYFPNITVTLTPNNHQPTNVTITRSGIGIFSRGIFL